jgi:hypothetical protein
MKVYVQTAVVMCALGAFMMPAQAASSLDNDVTLVRVALNQPVDLLAMRRAMTPPRIACSPVQSEKICELRNAAARRAWEVVTEEQAAAKPSASQQDGFSPGLLIPAGLIPVRAIACDPALSTEECAKLERRIPSNPPGPLPPNAQPPATPNPPPTATPPPPATVPEAKTPPTAIDPVPVTPPSVIPPPPTGDDDLVKRPPKSDSQMPVIKPKAAPPVNPQP